MNKLLTVSIAAYNVEKWIKQTLDSFIDPFIFDNVEVLIVNDGSRDKTELIAKEYETKYPIIFKVISKKNNGYGSTINTGIREATGRYFKVLDGDDWFDKNELMKALYHLRDCDADIVITPYKTFNVQNNNINVISLPNINKNELLNFNEIANTYKSVLAMHGITYKTSILKANNIIIDENCFYTDTEYVLFPLIYVNNVEFFDAKIYVYRIGMDGQSVGINGITKHYKDHIKVCYSLSEFFNSRCEVISNNVKSVIIYRIAEMISKQYNLFTRIPYSKTIFEEMLEFDKRVKEKYYQLYVESNNFTNVKLLRKTKFMSYWLLKLYHNISGK
ncbi:glycosyltransferase family 2 protein [Clostridium sp. C2-6-12]|uniref:glycosyltransferase family 2 protein n=1 Tax=Clostridium sp. C2-6-12 TaxID=2698832 RepID=UPI001369743D|nr:glycosyltransferase family 2 protein [Clostridium sp. C2-6-12]